MPITFQSLLAEANLALNTVRLLRHQPCSTRDPFTIWRTSHSVFEDYQRIQAANSRAEFAWPHWAAFAAVDGARTLFLGMYRTRLLGPVPTGTRDPIHGHELYPEKSDHYASELMSELEEYRGKVFIDWGPSPRKWNQRADKKPKPITELYEVYREPEFPGYLRFIKQISDLPSLPLSWVAALKNAKGVYLLTCPRDELQYVGKADGGDGFWGRWTNYIATGDGGNVKLKSREPSDYRVAILEVAGSAATPDDIGEMESRWKEKLQSRKMGLNAN